MAQCFLWTVQQTTLLLYKSLILQHQFGSTLPDTLLDFLSRHQGLTCLLLTAWVTAFVHAPHVGRTGWSYTWRLQACSHLYERWSMKNVLTLRKKKQQKVVTETFESSQHSDFSEHLCKWFLLKPWFMLTHFFAEMVAVQSHWPIWLNLFYKCCSPSRCRS